jgi:hypothetical protein
MNRRIARERLVEKLRERRQTRHREMRAATAKARRQKARRSLGEKRKLVEGKRHRSEIKKGRGRVSE